MTIELFEQLHRLEQRPELPRISDSQEVWDDYLQANQDWRRSFDGAFATFFEDCEEGTLGYGYRRGLWDHHHRCHGPPVLSWNHEFGLRRAALLTKAWLLGYMFAEGQSASRQSQ